MGQLPELLSERAGETAFLKAFEREGVPVMVTEHRHTPIPLFAMMEIFQSGASLLGDRTFGYEVGEKMTHRAYQAWMSYSLSASNLEHALRRSNATLWAHTIGPRLDLIPLEQHVLWRYASSNSGARQMQHADHLLPPMISYVRTYLGRNWQPDWVELNYARDADAGKLEERIQVPIRFEQPGVGVPIRLSDLGRAPITPLSMPAEIHTLREVVADMVLKDAPEPTRSLAAVIALRLLDAQSDIDGAARFFDMSARSLQRLLKLQGFTYREVLDKARLVRASGLLRETSLPIVDIALSLGYVDHACFTRAFSRWTGVSPSAFRQEAAKSA